LEKSQGDSFIHHQIPKGCNGYRPSAYSTRKSRRDDIFDLNQQILSTAKSTNYAKDFFFWKKVKATHSFTIKSRRDAMIIDQAITAKENPEGMIYALN
jgi:hypothetical protein